jgi:glycerol-3-phosphate dehydrogenase (NAD(P)+)
MGLTANGKSIAVLGAGSWGTALAIHLARSGNTVTLWGNEPEHIEQLKLDRKNQQFLPDIKFPDNLMLNSQIKEVLAGADLLLIVIPSYAFRSFLSKHSALITDRHSIIWASKGLEENTAKLLHQVIAEELPQCKNQAVISGPTFAKEVANDLPTAITVASSSESFANEVSQCLHSGNFRAYTSSDVIGVELGGALKNVLAIASGIADGLGYGANTRAALITRGLKEIMRLGEVMGGQQETFMGLAGMGDLVLTCTDNQSRNRQMGLLLAQGKAHAQIREEIGQEVEGVRTAREAKRLIDQYGIELPILEQVYKVLYENISPKDAVKYLLGRKSTSETN